VRPPDPLRDGLIHEVLLPPLCVESESESEGVTAGVNLRGVAGVTTVVTSRLCRRWHVAAGRP
jgi:hypothetical protein